MENVKVSNLEKEIGFSRNTLVMKCTRDPRVNYHDGEISREDAAFVLRNYYLNSSKYSHIKGNIQHAINKMVNVTDQQENVSPRNSKGVNVNYTPYKELPHGNAVITFMQGPIWKGILAVTAIVASTFYLEHFINIATLEHGIELPDFVKWLEAATVSVIGVTMAVTNKDKKIVFRDGYKSPSGRADRSELSISVANLWLSVFFSLEFLSMLCLWGIIQWDAAKLTILAAFVPVSTLSFAHLFVKNTQKFDK